MTGSSQQGALVLGSQIGFGFVLTAQPFLASAFSQWGSRQAMPHASCVLKVRMPMPLKDSFSSPPFAILFHLPAFSSLLFSLFLHSHQFSQPLWT